MTRDEMLFASNILISHAEMLKRLSNEIKAKATYQPLDDMLVITCLEVSAKYAETSARQYLKEAEEVLNSGHEQRGQHPGNAPEAGVATGE